MTDHQFYLLRRLYSCDRMMVATEAMMDAAVEFQDKDAPADRIEAVRSWLVSAQETAASLVRLKRELEKLICG
jgi:hypothetical protein